jgi:hypothetical protein
LSDQFIQVPPQSSGLKIDCTELVVGANTVERERQNIADPSNAAGLASVVNSSPSGSLYGLVTWNQPSGTQAISGTVAVSNLPGTQPVSGTVAATESGAWNINQTLSTPGYEALTDGTHGPVAVKASTTAATATDSALVVAISPNNSVAVTGTFFQGTQPVSGTVTSDIVGHAGATLDGTAGSPSTGVLTVQGVSGGTAQPVSGTVSVTNFANPLPVSQSGTWTTTVTQATASNLNATVTGTVSVNALPTGSATIGKVDILGNAGGIMDAAGQNASSPANELLVAGQFNTTPTTITSGNVSPLQLDSAGNLLVNVKVGGAGGSNAAAGATGSAVPADADYVGFNSGGNLVGVSTSNPLPVVQQGSVAVTQSTSPWVADITQVANTALGASAIVNYGSNPAAVAVPAVNAFITNAVSENLTQVAGTSLGATAVVNYGSTPAAVLVPAVNAFITNTPAVTLSSTTVTNTVTVSGTVTANQGTAAASTAGWPIIDGTVAETTAAWTTSTSVNTALALTVTGYSSVVVSLNQGSTISGGVVTFEASDTTAFTNAYGIQAVQTNAFTAASTYTLVQSTNQAFEVDVSGFAAFRVRLSTTISGTGTVNVGIAANAMAADPAVVVGGTVTANAGTGNFTVTQGTAANLNATVVGTGTFATQSVVTQGTASNLNATVVPGASAIFEVSPTTAANTNANPFFTSVTDGTTKVTVIAGTAALKTDLSSVAGTATVTAAAGVQKVGIVGNAGAVLDAVTTATTTPANGLATLVANVTTAPSLTTGQSVAAQCDWGGSLFVKPIRRQNTTSKATTIAASASATTILAAQAAGVFADISNIIITVTPTAGATAGVTFTATLSDGTNSYIFDMNTGNDSTTTIAGNPGDPINIQFNPPLPAASAATAWTQTNSVSTGVTTHTTVVAVLQKAS